MSKLLSLRSWLTIVEASQLLTTSLEHRVTEQELLRLGLEGHLPISINLISMHCAKLGYVADTGELEKEIYDACIRLDNSGLLSKDSLFLSRESKIKFTEKQKNIEGVFDLAMLGAERQEIQAISNCLDNLPVPDNLTEHWIVLKDPTQDFNCTYYELVDFESSEEPFLPSSFHSYYRASNLPSDAHLVIRTTALHSFIERVSNPKTQEISLPNTKSINTLYKTIYAISDALIGGLSGVKNKDASAILAQLDLVGVQRPISAKKLAEILSEASELVK